MPLPLGRVEGRLLDFGLTRSMSPRATSPDNAACEGFFGAFKNEVFYGRDWSGLDGEEFHGAARGDDEMVVVGPPQRDSRDDGPLRLRYDRRPPYAVSSPHKAACQEKNVRTPRSETLAALPAGYDLRCYSE